MAVRLATLTLCVAACFLSGGAAGKHLPPRHEAFRIAFVDARRGVMSAHEVHVPCPREVCSFDVYATADGGRSWRRVLQTPISVEYVAELAAASGTTFWASFPCNDDAACRPSLYRSSDGGRHWRLVSRAVAFAPSFASTRHGWAIGRGGVLVETSDGGRTWRPFRRDPCPPEASGWWHLARASASRGWVLCRDDSQSLPGERALYETRDGGRSWKLRASRGSALPSVGRGFDAAFAIRNISFLPSGRGWIWRYASDSPLVTLDGGRTWRRATRRWPFPSMVWGAAPTNSVAFALADTVPEQLLARTRDGGRSWRIVHTWPKRTRR